MSLLTTIPPAFVALLHIYIMILESFFWTTPRGLKAFGLSPSFAQQTKSLAQNQGLYNGFLAAGLIWGLLHPVEEFGRQVVLFNLGCVFVAGAVGGVTTGKVKIVGSQCVPAVIAISAVLFL